MFNYFGFGITSKSNSGIVFIKNDCGYRTLVSNILI